MQSVRSRSVAITALPVMMLVSSASAQLVTTTGVANFPVVSEGSYTELPGGAWQSTSDNSDGSLTFRMTGDVRLELDPNELPPSFQRSVTFQSTQQFTVNGTLPVQITPERIRDFKVVNAGGALDSDWGFTDTISILRIYETGLYNNGDPAFTNIGPQVYFEGGGSVNVIGNGFDIVSDAFTWDPYVLLPGVSYTAYWAVLFRSFAPAFDPADPQAAAFLEAGGFTNYDGIEWRLNAVTVPAPSALGVLGIGFAIGARRRR